MPTELGGDSLSALTFANLLREIFDIDVPVGVIVSPATVCKPWLTTSRRSVQVAPTGPASRRCTSCSDCYKVRADSLSARHLHQGGGETL